MTTDIIKEPLRTAFPSDAVWERSEAGVLKRITDRNGENVLWRPKESPPAVAKRPAEPKRAGVVTPEQVDQMAALKAKSKTNRQIAAALGLGVSTVERHLAKGRHDSVMASVMSQSRDLPATKNTHLPSATQQAIHTALQSAATTGLLADHPVIQSHYQGYVAGFYAALAILSGAVGFDLSFMEEKYALDSKRANATKQ